MKSILKSIFIAALFVFSQQVVFAQDADKTVLITVSGSGKTLDAAKQSAFRSAIEQAFGAFISSKTEILNDQVVADEISSVSSGNIKSFEMLNESQLPDGSWGVTLKATVSVDKLTSFVQAKGISIEIKGGMFALNIKQQLLNEQGEIKAIADMVGLLHEPMQTAFDYVIKSGEPKSLDAESKNWEIPLEVTATANKNIDFCANYFIKTLMALSLSQAEVETYKSLNKEVFPLSLNHLNINELVYLRKKTSIQIINSLISNWEFYIRLFAINSGIDESFGKGTGKIHPLEGKNYDSPKKIIFPTVGLLVATISYNDQRTLSQIEQMTGYTIKPRGVISKIKNGGYVVYEQNGHGLILALIDLEEDRLTWNYAKKACEELVMNGYSDWRLPTIKDLQSIYKYLYIQQIGNLIDHDNDSYWSSNESSEFIGEVITFYFGRDFVYHDNKAYGTYVRAVRSF